MLWRKVEIGELLFFEKGHEMQQIIGVSRQGVRRTPPSTQLPQEASDNGNGLAVIIEQFKGFVMGTRGFSVLPRRWVVERSLSWISRNRRLSKDYERKVQTSETLIQVAMIRLLIARAGRTSWWIPLHTTVLVDESQVVVLMEGTDVIHLARIE